VWNDHNVSVSIIGVDTYLHNWKSEIEDQVRLKKIDPDSEECKELRTVLDRIEDLRKEMDLTFIEVTDLIEKVNNIFKNVNSITN